MKRKRQLLVSVLLLVTLLSMFSPASAAGGTEALGSVPADALFSEDGSTLYLSDKAGQKVYSIDTETFAQKSISFDLMPESMFLKGDKLYVSLCTQKHSYYWLTKEQSGAYAIIDCKTFEVTQRHNINIDPYDIVVSDADIVYIASGSGQWTNIHGYDKEGAVVATGRIRNASTIQYNAGLDRIYSITSDCSPRNMSAFRIKEDGSFVDTGGNMGTSYDWPYGGGYDMGTAFHLSPDNAYIFNSSGNIFVCDSTVENDMKFKISLNKSWTDLAFNGDGSVFYTALDSAKQIYAYSYETFEGTATYETQGYPQRIYVKGDTLMAISRETLKGGKYFIETLDLSKTQTTIDTTKSTRTLSVEHGPALLSIQSNAKTVFAGDAMYIADEAGSALYAIDTKTMTEIKITLPTAPTTLYYHDGELLVGFGPSGMVVFFDAKTMVAKDRLLLGTAFYDAAIGKDGSIYVIENFGSSAFSYARSFSRATGQQISEAGVYPRNGKLVPHPTQNKFYWADVGVSPQDLNTLSYEKGVITEAYDSPYHGKTDNGPIGPVIKISPDGDSIYTSAGSVFACSATQAADMLYKGSFTAFVDLAFEPVNQRIFASQGRPNLTVFDTETYTGDHFLKTVFPVKQMALSGDTVIALSSDSGAFYLELLDTANIKKLEPESISLNVSEPVFLVTGGSMTLNPMVIYTDGTVRAPVGAVSYNSDDADTVSVDSSGVLNAQKSGHAKITIQCDGVEKILSVYVDFGITSLTVGGKDIGFSADKISYSVPLPSGTDQVPEVLYTATDGAFVSVKDADTVPGTTEITVTDQEKTFSKTYYVHFYTSDPGPSGELPFVFEGYYEIIDGMVHLTAWLEDNPNYVGEIPTEYTVIIQLMSYADEQPVMILNQGQKRDISVSFSQGYYAITMVVDQYGKEGYIGVHLAQPKRT